MQINVYENTRHFSTSGLVMIFSHKWVDTSAIHSAENALISFKGVVLKDTTAPICHSFPYCQAPTTISTACMVCMHQGIQNLKSETYLVCICFLMVHICLHITITTIWCNNTHSWLLHEIQRLWFIMYATFCHIWFRLPSISPLHQWVQCWKQYLLPPQSTSAWTITS